MPSYTERYTELREDTLSLFPGLIEIAGRPGNEETLDRLTAAERQLRDGTLRVVICGEYKRGKSSLLNMLLGEDPPLLPESTAITTSVVTTVRYGAQLRITVHRGSADEPQELQIERDKLPAYVTERGNPKNGKLVRSVDIALPKRLLASGLVLIDTPGIGGAFPDHRLSTDEVLPTADAIVFVTDTTQPLQPAELRFLGNAARTARLVGEEDALVFVLTKIDKLSDYADFLADTRARLAGEVGRPAEDVTIVPVSSKARRKYLSTGNSVQRGLSNFDELEDVLWGTLLRRQASMLLHGGLADLDEATTRLLQPIDDAEAALRSPSASHGLRSTIDARLGSLQKLAAADAPWRADLASGMAAIVTDVTRRTLSHSDDAWTSLKADLDGLLDDPDRLNDRVSTNVITTLGIADRLLDDKSARLRRQLAERYGLAVESAEMARLPAPAIPEIRVRAALPTARHASLRTTSAALSISSTLGAMLGKLLDAFLPVRGPGELLGGPIGSIIFSGVTGSVMLGKQARSTAVQSRDRKDRRAELAAEIDRAAADLREHVEAVISEIAGAFAEAIGDDLESLIKQALASAGESARRVRDSGPQDEAHAADLLRELEAERTPLDRLRARVAELSRLATDLASRPGHA